MLALFLSFASAAAPAVDPPRLSEADGQAVAWACEVLVETFAGSQLDIRLDPRCNHEPLDLPAHTLDETGVAVLQED